jgi:hypothetical protein
LNYFFLVVSALAAALSVLGAAVAESTLAAALSATTVCGAAAVESALASEDSDELLHATNAATAKMANTFFIVLFFVLVRKLRRKERKLF